MSGPFDDILPGELKAFFFDFDWDPKKVWSLDIPVTEIARKELDWHLTLPFWSTEESKPLFDVVPNDVLSFPNKYPEHFSRVLNADISYAIDLMWTVDRLLILDGMHRLARLKLDNIESVMIREVPRSMIELIKR